MQRKNKIIKGLEQAIEVVHASCGCVFCDLGLKPSKGFHKSNRKGHVFSVVCNKKKKK